MRHNHANGIECEAAEFIGHPADVAEFLDAVYADEQPLEEDPQYLAWLERRAERAANEDVA